ncbi:MAG: YceI family protein [Hyphomicrobiales bacterium]|nr:YceI family protein [Hyphomicrobiales bacterium]
MAYATATTPVTGDYGSLAKLLHWATAALIFAMVSLGVYMTQDGLDLATKFRLYQLHKSIGVTVLAITAIRLVARQINGVPALPAHVHGWERFAAHTAHGALYALVFSMTLTGWAMVSVAAFSIPTMLYGVIPWPHIPFLAELSAEHKKAAEAVFKQIHEIFAYTLTALIVVHIGAALRHALILKDGVMSRMLPRFLTKTTAVIICAGLAALVARPGDTQAYEWDVNPKTSRVGFEATAAGSTVKGAFEKFQAQVKFDPDMLADAEIEVAIDMASLKTGLPDADKTLTSAEWFDVKQHPQATFRGKGAKKIAAGKFQYIGDLTIKGVTKPAILAFNVEIEGSEAAAEGELTVTRPDYGVGPESMAGIPVPKDVKVVMSVKALKLNN